MYMYLILLDALTWTRIPNQGDIPTWGRFGHSADSYKKSVVVFGGQKHYNIGLRLRECLNDVKLFRTGKSLT